MEELAMEVPGIHDIHPATQITILVTRGRKRPWRSW